MIIFSRLQRSSSSSSSLEGAPQLTLRKYAPLPDIRKASAARKVRVERAADVFESNRAVLAASSAATLVKRGDVDPEEIARRKRHLAKQVNFPLYGARPH